MKIREKMLPFSLPVIEEDDIDSVIQVMKSLWLTTGPKANEFEKLFGEYVGAPYCCALTSATAGMQIVLKTLNLHEGDEVITPSMTWVSTINLIMLAGAKPVFADVDKHTLMISPKTVEKLITPKTKALIPVHFAGAPADMEALKDLSLKHGFSIIEDAAHAVGTEYQGRKIGSSGTCIFSFHPIKI